MMIQKDKIRNLDIDKQKITLYRAEDDVGKLEIPSQLLDRKIPINAIWEIEKHFDYIIKKYALDSK